MKKGRKLINSCDDSGCEALPWEQLSDGEKSAVLAKSRAARLTPAAGRRLDALDATFARARAGFPRGAIGSKLRYILNSSADGRKLVRLLVAGMTNEELAIVEANGRKARNARRTEPDGTGTILPGGALAGARPTPSGAARREDRALKDRVARLAARPEGELRAALGDLERERALEKTNAVDAQGPPERVDANGAVIGRKRATTQEAGKPVRLPTYELKETHIAAERPQRMTDREDSSR